MESFAGTVRMRLIGPTGSSPAGAVSLETQPKSEVSPVSSCKKWPNLSSTVSYSVTR